MFPLCHAGIVLSVIFLAFCIIFRNLSNNKITDIEEGAFEGANGVNELILTSNRIENVHHKIFKGLDGLKSLYVFWYLILASIKVTNQNLLKHGYGILIYFKESFEKSHLLQIRISNVLNIMELLNQHQPLLCRIDSTSTLNFSIVNGNPCEGQHGLSCLHVDPFKSALKEH